MIAGIADAVLPEAAVRTLLGPESATAALGRWFADAPVTAQVFAGESAALPRSIALWLASPGDELGYRHVQLVSGATVLSEAQIWYRTQVLSADMRRLLSETGTPFGAVVRPLNPERVAIAVRAAPLRIDAILRVGETTLALARERYFESALAAGWNRRESAARAA